MPTPPNMDALFEEALRENTRRNEFNKAKSELQALLDKEASNYNFLMRSLTGMSSLQRRLDSTGFSDEYKQQIAAIQAQMEGIDKKFGQGSLGGMVIGKLAPLIIPALADMTRITIELDTQMNELKRVLGEFTNVDQILQNSAKSAAEVGRSMKEVNQTILEFSRMGFDESQVNNLARTALIMQNISDMSPQQTIEAVSTAVTKLGTDSSSSLSVADQLLEVDRFSLLIQ
ncbi:phage tail tape measure protein [Paenibacillus sp. FSL K6-1230]|uniref:phage tail tape measure protein n=1 Tax=Paenibacillus sp. FSL K6-1230 TaxID=2921603 RepID=UPI0030FD07A2